MQKFVLYLFPMLFDIVIALVMFVGRHSYAERSAGAMEIGAFAAVYGSLYIPSSYFIGKVLSPKKATGFLLTSIVLMIIILCLLANIKSYPLFLAIFAGVPIAASLFFNAFQSYMLHTGSSYGKDLSRSAGHYTFSWSLGFALGPVVSYFGYAYLDWSASLYLAAMIMAVVGVIALLLKPDTIRAVKAPAEDGPAPELEKKALPLSGWLGVLIATSTFQIILVYWPLLAVQLQYSTLMKVGIEFSEASVQALAALVICLFVSWHHKPWMTLCFGLVGVLALSSLSLANSPGVFLLGAILFGIYSSRNFIYMVYHSMLDKEKAAKRVSINEVMVGAGSIIGPFVAVAILKLANNDFHHAFAMTLAVFSVAVLFQTEIARRENRRARHRK